MDEFVRRWMVLADSLEVGSDAKCLEAVRAWIREWDHCFWTGDFSGFDEVYAAEFVGESRVPLLPVKNIRGPDSFAEVRAEAVDVASRFWFDISELRRGSDGRFAGLGKMRTRGRYSGMVVQSPWAVVWTVHNRRISRAVAFAGHRKALRELAVPAAASVA